VQSSKREKDKLAPDESQGFGTSWLVSSCAETVTKYHLRMKLMRRLKQEKMTQKVASFLNWIVQKEMRGNAKFATPRSCWRALPDHGDLELKD
jgi:hypothetical protein